MFWNKKDNSSAIESVVLSLASTGQETGVLPWLSMKDAIRYAYTKEQHPVVDKHNTSVQCHVTIGGVYYNLSFQTHPNKGVYLTPFKYFDVDK